MVILTVEISDELDQRLASAVEKWRGKDKKHAKRNQSMAEANTQIVSAALTKWLDDYEKYA